MMLTPDARSTSNVTRRVRRFGLTLLPPRQRARLRHFYEAATAPAERASGTFSHESGSVAVRLEQGTSFRILSECAGDVEGFFGNPVQAAELAAFVREAAEPGLLFDVGAHNGMFALVYCQAHAANRAVAFEPSPLLAARIEKHTRLNGLESRQTVVCTAIGDAAGTRDMLVDASTGWVQIEKFAGTAHAGWRGRVIETTTIDRAAALYGAPSIVKIDVEGFEWEVLQGASNVLSTIRPVLFLELHLNYLEERGIDPRRLLHDLTSHGYELFHVSGRRVSGDRAARSWASVLHLIGRHRDCGPSGPARRQA